MNTSYRLVAALTLSTILLSHVSLKAGHSRKSIADGSEVPVAISSFNTVEFAQSTAETLEEIMKQAPVVLSTTQREGLVEHANFRGLSGTQIDAKYHQINRLTVESIQAVRAGNPRRGANLLGFYLIQRIGLATGGPQGLTTQLREDGSDRIGDESINIYYIPEFGDGYRVYDPTGFNYALELDYLANLAELPGYEGRPLQNSTDWANYGSALFNEAYLANGSRYQITVDTITVMDGIQNNLAIPPGINGTAFWIGQRLLDDTELAEPEKRDKAARLQGYLNIGLPFLEHGANYFDTARTAATLFLDGKFPSAETYTDLIKPVTPWHHHVVPMSGDFEFVLTYGGGGHFDQTDPSNPVLLGETAFFQRGVRNDGTTFSEEIYIGEVDYLSGGWRWDDNLLLAGWSVSDAKTFFLSFKDTDADGFVKENSKQILFDTDMFQHGLQFNFNAGQNKLYGFDLGTRNLYEMNSFNADGFPTGFAHRGGLGNQYKDVTRVGFSPDGDWAVGYQGCGFALQPNTLSIEARFDSSLNEFDGFRLGYPYREVEQEKPAIAEIPQEGESIVRVTGTPDSTIHAWKIESGMATEIGSARTDPYGRAFLETSEPFSVDLSYRFSSDGGLKLSADYKVPPLSAGSKLLAPHIGEDGETLRFGLLASPDTDITINSRELLNQMDFSIMMFDSTSLGAIDREVNLEGKSSLFVQAETSDKETEAKPDHIGVSPTREFVYYPAWNDVFRYGANFTPSRQADETNPYQIQPGMSSLTSRLLLFANAFAPVNYQYRLQQQQQTIKFNTLIFWSEIQRAMWPPVYYNDQGEAVIDIPCLVFGGFDYPIYQFFMRPPDNCFFIHWHSPLFPRVHHLANDPSGSVDPDPPVCGYGAILEVPIAIVEVPFQTWLDFTKAHPYPSF